MTSDELRAAYPGAADAVVLYEGLHPCGKPPYPWHMYRSRSPKEALDTVRRLTDESLSFGPPAGVPEFAEMIRPQMDHPDFARYVAARLGSF